MKKYFFLLQLFLAYSLFAQGGIFDEITGTLGDLAKTTLNIVDISESEENQIGDALEAELQKKHRNGSSKKWDVNGVFKKVVKNVTRKKIDYRFKIVSDKEVNAFAIAGGMIYINTGMLDFIRSEAELAFIIGHELAHIEKKHCINQIKLTYLAGKFDANLAVLADALMTVYSLPFSKYDEFEADDYGVKLMQKAGYDKKAAVDFFNRLAKHYKEAPRDPVNDFIATHPLSVERAKRIEKMK